MWIRFFLIIFLTVFFVRAQDLNCVVEINATQINSSDPTVFNNLQNALQTFLNGQHWTSRSSDAKIDCKITLFLEQQQGNFFSGRMRVQANRPVYHTDYQSPLINFQDNDVQFHYVANDILQYNENFLSSNLVALCAYYAYFFIGLDAASFSPDAGLPYFQKMLQITDLAQQNNFHGWEVSTRNNGRYAYVNALVDTGNKSFRELYYYYHRLAIDLLADKPEQAQSNIVTAFNDFVTKTSVNYQNAFLIQTFFDAKTAEIKSIFSRSSYRFKKSLKNTLNKIQPNRDWNDF